MKASVANSRLDKRIERIEKMIEALMEKQGLPLPEAEVGGIPAQPNKTFVSDPKPTVAENVETEAERKAREKAEAEAAAA